ncbi:alpha-L-fucosidase [Pedobacter frigiditerrae]|uniref:alpha-L-fucosidase n=1 Tax=Pedobacter frigiditerrae TaxID=2530452 RepID=UPI002930A3EC|nr:alpha-L-fucosidase [Pedobacter frigiditerrae]
MKKIIILLLLGITSASAQNYQPNWSSLDSRPVPQWFKDSKFGIFIHWGVYSVPAYGRKGSYSEWYQRGLTDGDTARVNYHKAKFGNLTYYELADQFKAELFKPDEWANLIEKSGAKYVVLTSKHHDGYALWPSKETDKNWGFPWNAVTIGPHRDLLGDLFKAIRKTSVHPGLYYSLMEWYNPLWRNDKGRYVNEHAWPQMKDLVNTYKPDVFWTDGEWEASAETWKSKEFLAWLYNDSPIKQNVVTYDRWGSGDVRFKHGAVFTPEYQPDLDFENHYWEESRGMGFSYGYNREEDAWDYNSAQSLVLQLIDKVSRGGNFLLDIGPDEHGKIPPIMQERLLQIGNWMNINGEAIYGTERWRNASQWSEGRKDYNAKDGSGDYLLKITLNPETGYAVKNCFFTYNATTNNLYALLPIYPSDKKIVLQNLSFKSNTRIELLETKESLKWENNGNDVVVTLPSFDPNKIKSNYAYVLKIFNYGAFSKKPKVSVNYSIGALNPVVTISSNDEIRYTLDGTLPTTTSNLYQSPLKITTSSTLNVKAFAKNILPSELVTIPLKVYQWKNAIIPKDIIKGLTLSIYESFNSSVDELEKLKPIKIKSAVQISLVDTTRKEQVGLIYEGYIKIPETDIYDFFLTADDGSNLWIDGELLDNDGLHGGIEKMEKFALKKGFHSLKISYFQATGDAELSLKVASSKIKKQNVPMEWFFQKLRK